MRGTPSVSKNLNNNNNTHCTHVRGTKKRITKNRKPKTMGNTISGESATFAKRTFVRVNDVPVEVRRELPYPEWTADVDATIGEIGYVCGGSKDSNLTRVIFVGRGAGPTNDTDWWVYRDAHLTAVPVNEVPEEHAKALKKAFAKYKTEDNQNPLSGGPGGRGRRNAPCSGGGGGGGGDVPPMMFVMMMSRMDDTLNALSDKVDALSEKVDKMTGGSSL